MQHGAPAPAVAVWEGAQAEARGGLAPAAAKQRAHFLWPKDVVGWHGIMIARSAHPVLLLSATVTADNTWLI